MLAAHDLKKGLDATGPRLVRTNGVVRLEGR